MDDRLQSFKEILRCINLQLINIYKPLKSPMNVYTQSNLKTIFGYKTTIQMTTITGLKK